MEYKYTIGASDLMTLNNTFTPKNPEREKTKQRLKLVPALVIIGMLFANYLTRGYFSPAGASVLGIFFIIWYLYADKMLNYFMTRRVHKLMHSKQNKWLTKERIMHLNEDYFLEEISGADSSKILEMKYEDLNKVEMTENAIYLFIDEVNSYIIPKRAFKDNQEMTKAYEFIKSRSVKTEEPIMEIQEEAEEVQID